MTATIIRRDYGLLGSDGQSARDKGLATAKWYAAPVARKDLKELMKRSDGPAIRDTLIWFAALAAIGFRRCLVLGHVGLRAVLPGLWRALRVGLGLPLARMRPWHGIQDALDERRRL